MKIPTVGMIVHYQSYGTPNGEYKPLPRAAVITEVEAFLHEESGEDVILVGLCIMNPTGLFFTQRVHYSEDKRSGCWSYPPDIQLIESLS